MRKSLFLFFLLLLSFGTLPAQDQVHYQTDFSVEELSQRRNNVMHGIGNGAVAIIQGAPDVQGFSVFRQSNTFYYLTGLETPHSYLFLDGRNGTAALYMPHRNPGRERGEGKTLSAEDAELVVELTGVDAVYPIEDLARHWTRAGLVRPPFPDVYTPFSPPEAGTDSRDELLRYRSSRAADPWDGQVDRQEHFIHLLRTRYPGMNLFDLSPVLDKLRNIKSTAEIDLIRKASQLAGFGLMEAMRCTQPGVMEYQLEACAQFIHASNGSKRPGYGAITGGGTNAWMGHYFRNADTLRAGDTVLMDYAPEYHYYTSDVTRMWPVNGSFTREQRVLHDFVVAYRQALFNEIKPGASANDILDAAAATMTDYVETHNFIKPEYEAAVRKALTFRGHLQHPVGMAVHDVGNYKATPMTPGEVFAVDPMIWIPEENLYVRIEDVVVITEKGMENFTDFVPATADEIEKLMLEEGILQKRPVLWN